VVGGLDLGESDRVVRLLSASRGRVSVLARRARASKRRFAGMFEAGNAIRVSARGRGDLAAVTAVDLVRTPLRAREDLDRIAYLAYGCEICAALAPEDSAADRLFGLLESWLARLEGPSVPPIAARLALEAKALTFAGLAPRLVDCSRCGGPIDDPAVWDPDIGGAAHARCAGGRPVLASVLRGLEKLRRTPLNDVESGLSTWILTDAIEHQLARRLHSRAMLDVVREAT
jgi:DNA repair protein RecO (recombination protein O)